MAEVHGPCFAWKMEQGSPGFNLLQLGGSLLTAAGWEYFPFLNGGSRQWCSAAPPTAVDAIIAPLQGCVESSRPAAYRPISWREFRAARFAGERSCGEAKGCGAGKPVHGRPINLWLGRH